MSDTPTTVVLAPIPPPDFIQLITSGRLTDGEFVFAIAMIVLLRTIYTANKRGLDFTDLIVGDDGKMAWSKVLACTCGITTTWGFATLLLDGRMTEWYFNGYVGLCLGASIWMKWMAAKYGGPSPASPTSE